MKLRNKKTGEIGELRYHEDDHFVVKIEHSGKPDMKNDTVFCTYDSLAELNEEWEDYEEPKKYWYIDDIGLTHEKDANGTWSDEYREEIGNYFPTEEEAEQAVEKLKAWKRLKDKGFKFDEYAMYGGGLIVIDTRIDDNEENYSKQGRKKIIKDLDLLFSGEDEE